MKLIIEKIDYDLHSLIKSGNIQEAHSLWQRIQNSTFTLQNAISVVEDSDTSSLTFLAPTICYGILSCAEQTSVTKQLIGLIIRNPELGKINVNGISFLDLVLQRKDLEMDDYEKSLIQSTLFTRCTHSSIAKSINYNQVETSEDIAVRFKNDEFDFLITMKEAKMLQTVKSIEVIPDDTTSLCLSAFSCVSFTDEEKERLVRSLISYPIYINLKDRMQDDEENYRSVNSLLDKTLGTGLTRELKEN